LIGCELLTDNSIKEIARNCLRIEKINLNSIRLLTEHAILTFTKHGRNIKELQCLGISAINDEVLYALEQQCKMLEYISFSTNCNVTKVSMDHFKQQRPFILIQVL